MLVTCELYRGKSITKCLWVMSLEKLVPVSLLCVKTSTTTSRSQGAWEPQWTAREPGLEGRGQWTLKWRPISEHFANTEQS